MRRTLPPTETFAPSADPRDDEIARLRAELDAARERTLDLEDDLRRAEGQQEVLENFCFAIEQEHMRARELIEQTQTELVASYNRLRELKVQQDDILATVDQGICTLERDGRINAGCSSRTRGIFGRDVVGLRLVDLFDEPLRRRVERHIQALFASSWMDDRSLAKLNPLREVDLEIVDQSGERRARHLCFTFARIAGYHPSATGPAPVARLLVVIDDRTVEHELGRKLEQKAAETAHKLETMYRVLMLPRRAFHGFLAEADAALASVDARLAASDGAGSAFGVLRALHTIKGNARALGLDRIAAAAHAAEDAAAERDAGAEAAGALRGALEWLRRELDDSNSLLEQITGMRAALEDRSRNRVHELEHALRDLIAAEAPGAGKEVELSYHNPMSLALPDHLLVHLRNALIQLVRNAIAHGIEPAAERVRVGKPSAGTIAVSLAREDGWLAIACRDDGRGIDRDAVRRVALERGLTAGDLERMGPTAELELIFQPGLSTNAAPDQLSGRGIGMDVVRENISALGGAIEVRSQRGAFTELTLRLPLTSVGVADREPDRRAL